MSLNSVTGIDSDMDITAPEVTGTNISPNNAVASDDISPTSDVVTGVDSDIDVVVTSGTDASNNTPTNTSTDTNASNNTPTNTSTDTDEGVGTGTDQVIINEGKGGNLDGVRNVLEADDINVDELTSIYELLERDTPNVEITNRQENIDSLYIDNNDRYTLYHNRVYKYIKGDFVTNTSANYMIDSSVGLDLDLEKGHKISTNTYHLKIDGKANYKNEGDLFELFEKDSHLTVHGGFTSRNFEAVLCNFVGAVTGLFFGLCSIVSASLHASIYLGGLFRFGIRRDLICVFFTSVNIIKTEVKVYKSDAAVTKGDYAVADQRADILDEKVKAIEENLAVYEKRETVVSYDNDAMLNVISAIQNMKSAMVYEQRGIQTVLTNTTNMLLNEGIVVDFG